MNDLISRQAAIEALRTCQTYLFDIRDPDKKICLESAVCELEQLPSVQPERWIPCSERLPEDYEDVLVWFEYFRYGNYNCLYQMYGIGSYSSGYNSWLINQETGWNELKVFAWMPLPEPYKEGTNNQITACPMCPGCPDNCPLGEDMRGDDHETD